MNNNISEAWDTLNEMYWVSEETLKIVTSINGYNLETIEDILYAVAGERSFNI